MGRPKGSKNRKMRAKPRTAYETYEYWYDKYTKGHKAGWFSDKLSQKEFEQQYRLAKNAKLTNPARTVAMSQEYVDRTFERRYKQITGHTLGDIRDKAERVKIFEDFVDDMQAQGLTYDEARDEFESAFYN